MMPLPTDVAGERKQALLDLVEALADRLASRTFSPRLKLLDIKQVCEALRLEETTIYRMMKAGNFPKPIEGVGKNLWRESTLLRWLDVNDPNPRAEGDRG